MAMAFGAAPAISTASAATTTTQSHEDQVNAELQKLQGEISESYGDEARVVAELRVSQKNRQALDAKVAALDASLAKAQTALDELNVQLDQATAAALTASSQLDAAKDALDEQTNLLKSQAISAYIKFAGKPSIPEAISSIEDVNQVPRVILLAEAVSRNQAQVVEKHRVLNEQLSGLRAQADAAKEQVAADRQKAADQTAQLASQRAEQAAARAEAKTEEANEQRLLAQIQSSRADAERKIADLQATSDSITTYLRGIQAGEPSAPSAKGFFTSPIASPTITSEFGYRVDPILNRRLLHAGADFRANTGQPIWAAAAGKVVFAGVMTGYGNVVIVDHGNSLATLYAHQSKIGVSVGQQVKKGQVIGYVGMTGYATGPHLHFEIRIYGVPVNPRNYL
jgi:murein DD-endopeptidase MepM/ murein hydrolase activator NlpD